MTREQFKALRPGDVVEHINDCNYWLGKLRLIEKDKKTAVSTLSFKTPEASEFLISELDGPVGHLHLIGHSPFGAAFTP